VVGHAFRRRDRDLRRTAVAIDLVQRRACDAAGEQSSGLVDAEAMDAMKRRAGNEFGDLICLRGGAGGKKHSRSHGRTKCKPARHDATSRFYCRSSIRPRLRFGKQNLSMLRDSPATKLTCRAAENFTSSARVQVTG